MKPLLKPYPPPPLNKKKEIEAPIVLKNQFFDFLFCIERLGPMEQ